MFKCSFDEFVGEKVFSPSYSSAILAPPRKRFLRLNVNQKVIHWALLKLKLFALQRTPVGK